MKHVYQYFVDEDESEDKEEGNLASSGHIQTQINVPLLHLYENGMSKYFLSSVDLLKEVDNL